MSTQIEIVNIALAMISANLITGIDDDSDEARLARLHYGPARDATLEAQEWTFAMTRFMPAKNAEAPLFGYSAAFDLPTEILRVVACERIGEIPANMVDIDFVSQPDQIDWILENRQILCDVDVVHARGIQRVESEGVFSPLFVHAFAAKLGLLMCYPLTQSSGIATTVGQMYAGFLLEAKSRDAIQGRSRRIRNKSLLRAR